MPKQPLVTIITPSFNQSNYIGATIASVLEQSYANIEYFIIDGGSTDHTVDILKACDDPRVWWVSEPDNGQSDAINKGLRLASGKYVSYLNSDDLLLPNAVQFIVDYFERHPETALVYSDCAFIDTEGVEIKILQATSFNVSDMIIGMQTILQPGTFWRRTLTERIGLMDETLHYTMDADYWLRVALAGYHLQYVPGTRSAFRLHSASKTVSQSAGFWKDWRVMLDKSYGAQSIPETITGLKEVAYQRLEWYDLKNDWANGIQDRHALRPFLTSGMLSRRIIARLMWVESFTGIPLLRWASALSMRIRGVKIIG